MDYQKSIIGAIKKVLPAVVSIAVAKDLEDIKRELPFDMKKLNPYDQAMLQEKIQRAPRDEHGRIKIGGGSGFIISPDGLILTNKHVVMDPNASYSVVTPSGKTYDTEIVTHDPINDIAILRINDGEELPYVEFESSKDLELGQTAIAIGNALGEFTNSVSTGIVSGLSRLITATTDMAGHQERLRGLIQTDAAINPGNSGGPLINLDGKAIGINVAVVFGAQNIGFAIPIERAKKDLDEIKEYGHIRRPFVGIRYVMINKAIQEHFNLPIDHGALIVNEGGPGDVAVVPGSAAEKSGLKEFDVILSCNGEKVDEKNTFEDHLAKQEIGDTVELEIFRNGKKETINLTLEEFKKPAPKMQSQQL